MPVSLEPNEREEGGRGQYQRRSTVYQPELNQLGDGDNIIIDSL